MKLCITGLNHKTAPVSVRERLAFSNAELAAALADLKRRPGLQEGLILSTCNRVEVAVSASDETDARSSLEEFLLHSHGEVSEGLQNHLYWFEGREAVRHIFRVAASLDSMVVGEPQILGQLKSAYSVAKQQEFLGGFLDSVLTRAFGVAKRVRTETEIGVSAVSVSYAAIELAREIFGSLSGKKVMLIGAGKMSELAGRHLKRSGVQQIFVTNRTESRAHEVAAQVGGIVVKYSEYRAFLKDVDIVLSSSGAPGYLLTKDDMRAILNARRNRVMFLIDIAVPRNIDPAVNELDNVFVYDIDDLQKVVGENLRARLDEAVEADKIVDEEVERLDLWLKSRHAGPIIANLQQHLEQVRLGEIERMRAKLGPLTPQQAQAIDALTKGIVNKIAHGPISELRKHAALSNGAVVTEAIRNMFGLEE